MQIDALIDVASVDLSKSRSFRGQCRATLYRRLCFARDSRKSIERIDRHRRARFAVRGAVAVASRLPSQGERGDLVILEAEETRVGANR